MPELPEVQTVVDTLKPRLIGAVFARVGHLRSDIVSPDATAFVTGITGHTVERIDRRGKRIVFTLDDGNRFYVHLGMTGQLTVAGASDIVKKHTHFVADLSGIAQLRFRDARRFGGIFWLGRDQDWQDLGPEPLTITPARLAFALSRTKRAIKTALLDQALIAGIGNIYADEALFAARINPRVRSNRLSREETVSLTRAIKQVLRLAIKHRGSTLRDFVDADGATGGYRSRHRVYDRTGEPCCQCGKPVRRIVLGGRSTHFCQYCQRMRPRWREVARHGPDA